jgi:hypothetical protein
MDSVLPDPLAWHAIVDGNPRADLIYALAVLKPLPDPCSNSIRGVDDTSGSMQKHGAILA